jgi:hypothetical protein
MMVDRNGEGAPMKISLEAIDGQQFTLRLPVDGEAREHVVALHVTRRLRGAYAHDALAFRLDPVEADEIIGELTWQLAGGALRLAGPARLGPTRLDLDIGRGGHRPALAGEARCASLAAPVASLAAGALDLRCALDVDDLHALHDPAADAWAVAAPALAARALVVAQPGLRAEVESAAVKSLAGELRAGSVRLTADGLQLEGVFVSAGGLTVTVAAATVKGLAVSREAGAIRVEAEAVALRGVEVDDGSRRARAPDAWLTGLRYGPDGVSFDGLDAGELTFAVEGLGAPRADDAAAAKPEPEGPTRQLGVDLAFLDGLHGRIEADTRVDVRLPVIRRRVATHTARLDIADGGIDFKELEHGLSRLEDAILDFEVEDHGLALVLDAVVLKKTLVTWALDAAGVARARQGSVSLRALAQPTLVTRAEPADEPTEAEAEGRVGLRRVEVDGLRAELQLRGGAVQPLGGGALRLGAEGAPAVGSLRVSGALLHDPARTDLRTELSVELAQLHLGADGVSLGGRRLDVATGTLGALTDGFLTLRGFQPAGLRGTLRELSVRALRLRSV